MEAQQEMASSPTRQDVPPPPAPLAPEEPSSYALHDEEYGEWKSTLAACQQAPDSVEALRSLAQKPKLLNWRSPVSGQTLLHEMACRGASDDTIEAAVQLGCQRSMRNAKGEDVSAIAARKRAPKSGFGGFGSASSASAYGSRSKRSQAARLSAGGGGALSDPFPSPAPLMQQQLQQQAADGDQEMARPEQPSMMRSLRNMVFPPSSGPVSAPPALPSSASPSKMAALSPFASWQSPQAQGPMSAPSSSMSGQPRKAGKKMATSEVQWVPKSRMNVSLNVEKEQDFDLEELERSIQISYGGSARVQIDEVADVPSTPASSALPLAASSSAPRAGKRMQNVSCRVMFGSAEEAKTWSAVSTCSRQVQTTLASAMAIDGAAVEFEDGGVQMDTVDAVTLKLDSDSRHILCGACLAYNAQDECAKVVCHSDRYFQQNSVQHSGDTVVDGKSVHTISVVMSKVPEDITQLYFTICSCGPSDLSGFKNPSIMLYENAQPDANLLEYSIDQAEKSVSSVMARMIRRPVWNAVDRVLIERTLRKLKMPLLCIDLCMAMAAETSWDIQALGTPEWHLPQKICSNYGPGKDLISENLRKRTAVTTSRVSVQRGRPSTIGAGAAAAAAAPAAPAAPASPAAPDAPASSPAV